MTVSEKIKDDWGTIQHFAKKNGLNPQIVRNCLCGRTNYKTVVSKLLECGYINSINDLKRKVA